MKVRRRFRSIALVAAVVMGLGSLSTVVIVSAPAGAAPGFVTVVTPADGSQVPADGTVPVEVTLKHNMNPSTFLASLEGGGVTTDVTALFTVAGTTVSATLTSAELSEGVNVLTVSAQPGNGNPNRPSHAGRKYASVTMSWEPQIDLATAGRCDILDDSKCLFPFPNDHFTVEDPSMDSGRRINFEQASMPANAGGVHIDPTEWNRNDGFSPGSSGLLHIPGIDLAQSGAAPITAIEQSLEADAPVLMIDVDTGQRIPLWVEADLQVTGPNDVTLMVRPAVQLREEHRHIVAFRGVRDTNGDVIEPGRGFEIYRDAIPTFAPEVEDRRAAMEDIFATLAANGVGRDDLYVAWDFTVSSARNLTERLLHIRDDAFGTLGDDAPSFTVTQVVENPFGADSGIARRVSGTYQVPHYLTNNGAPGSIFVNGPDGLPVQQGIYTALFTCIVPRTAAGQTADPEPGRAVLYGHGIFGSHTQVTGGRFQAQGAAYNMVFCGTTTIGYSDDPPTILNNFQEMTRVQNQADRSQQGLLNTLFLGRLMKHDEGLVSHSAFQTAGGDPAIDTSDLFYTGQSQGSLSGGAVTAVAQDWTRAVLTAPSMNGSLVLHRSTQGPLFVGVLKASYPTDLDGQLLMGLLQMLTDRTEPAGYAWHLTDEDPLPNTPAKQVLLQAAFGDYQTTTISPEIMARTMGIPMHRPALLGDRFYQVNPFFGIPAIDYPYTGGALIMFDRGNFAPPVGNVPPPSPGDPFGDPHGIPTSLSAAQQQLSHFFDTGSVLDVCGGPCYFGP